MLLAVVFFIQVFNSNGDYISDILHHIFLLLPLYGCGTFYNGGGEGSEKVGWGGGDVGAYQRDECRIGQIWMVSKNNME